MFPLLKIAEKHGCVPIVQKANCAHRVAVKAGSVTVRLTHRRRKVLNIVGGGGGQGSEYWGGGGGRRGANFSLAVH